MSEARAVEASPELLYIFFRSIADLPSNLAYLATEGGLTRNQLSRIRSFSVQDFRRLRQLCPIYFRAINVSLKLDSKLLDEALRALEAAGLQPLQFSGEPSMDCVQFRALLLYVNSLQEDQVDRAYVLGLNPDQVRRIRQLPVAIFSEMHKLEPRLAASVRIFFSLAADLLDRLLQGLSMDRYQTTLQDALLERGAPYELMHSLFDWTRATYDARAKGFPPAAARMGSGVDQLKVWVAWEENQNVPTAAERYLTTAQLTGFSLADIWNVISRLEQNSGRVLLGLLGQWKAGAADKPLPRVFPDLSPDIAGAVGQLEQQKTLADFVAASLRVVKSLTGAPGAGFLLVDKGGSGNAARLILLAADGVGPLVAQAAQVFSLEGSFTGAAIGRRRVQQGTMTRAPEANDALVEALVSENMVHATTVPLLDGKRALGAINLHSPYELDLSPKLETDLMQLGSYLARRLNELQPVPESASA